MKKRTFYVYDDTNERFINASNHVINHLKENFNIEKTVEHLTTRNDHPAGDDCICVDVAFNEEEILNKNIKSLLGNTQEYEDYFAKRKPTKQRKNRKERKE